MTDVLRKPARLMALLLTGAIIAALPAEIGFGTGTGLFELKPSFALARGGDDDSGSDDHGGDDDDSDDDSDDRSGSDDDDDDGKGRGRGRGRGRGGDDLSKPGGGVTPPGGGAGTGGSNSAVAKIEVSASGIEVTFTDGTKIEVENGRYERKDSSGNTVEERPATQADVDALMSLT